MWPKLLLAGERGPELVDVALPHAREVVEALGVVRRHTGDRRGGDDAVRKERCAGQGVRAAAADAPGAEAVNAERVRDRGGVGRGVGDLPARPPAGFAVTGTVVADQT